MNYIEHRFSLVIDKAVSQTVVKVKKRDTLNRLLITLTDHGYPYHLSEECRAFYVEGDNIMHACKIDNCTIIYDLTTQTVGTVGKHLAEIRLIGYNDEVITTAKFTVIVENTIYNDNHEVTIPSNDVSALTGLISEASQIIDEVKESLDNGDFNGKDGITPQLRINASTNEWEISTDKGVTWASTGVKATGKNGESVVITEVEESDEPGGENVVTFSDGQILVIKNGKNGSPGGPGFSPTVDIKEIENAYRITITDKDHGPQSFDVPNYKSAPSEAVLYTEQKLTEEQQGRARGNISAAPVPLIVTIKDGYASHTPAEMYAHMEKGGTVYLHDESYGLFNTSYGDSGYWYFYYVTAYGGDGLYVCEYEIHSDKMAFFYEADISSEEATDGVTPHIGANGNWYIGETDTGVKAQGQDGHTPVKGKDYNTEADKQELVDMVLDALPMAEEASF